MTSDRFLMMRKWQSGIRHPDSQIASADLNWFKFSWLSLTVFTLWRKEKKRWMDISAPHPPLSQQDFCTQKWLCHILLWDTRSDSVRRCAVIKQKSIQIEAFTSDKPDISAEPSTPAGFFLSSTRVKKEKVRCVKLTQRQLVLEGRRSWINLLTCQS